MKLEDFMEKYKPLKKVSALEPYQEEIRTLLDNNYTQEQILEFLKISKNVQVSRQALSSFLKKSATKNKVVTIQKTTAKEPKKTENTKEDEIAQALKKWG